MWHNPPMAQKKNEPLSPEEARKRAIEAIEEGRFELAPHENADDLEPYVSRILGEAFGIEGALVTDMSCISDFIGYFADDPQKDLDAVSEVCGFEVSKDDLLWEIAAKMRNREDQSVN